MADNTNLPDNDGWGSEEEKRIYSDFMDKMNIERTKRAWEKGERAPGTVDLNPVEPKELDVTKKDEPAKPAGVFSNIDAFVKQAIPKSTPATTKPVDSRVVKTGTGGDVTLGSGGKLKTRSPDEFSNDPQSYYKRMMRPGQNEDVDMTDLMKLSGLLNEKAVSQQQQKFMGMVHAMQKGKKVKGASKELKKVAKTMSKKDAKDFAGTKHKGLPKRVTEDVMLDEAGETLNHIKNRFKYEVKMFMQTGQMDKHLFSALYDYYRDKGEIPYDVAAEDPHMWIEERFYQDMGSGMSEGTEMDLNELARLAGLKTEGIGDKAAYAAGNVAGKVAAIPGKIAKGAGEMADQFKMGTKDAEIGRQSYPVPTPDVKVRPDFAPIPKSLEQSKGLNPAWDPNTLYEEGTGIQVHDLSSMDDGSAYDETQSSDQIHDGDVLITRGGVGIMVDAWPVMVTGSSTSFHKLKPGTSWTEFADGKYIESAKKAMEVAGAGLEEEYANEPEEEYQTIASITRRGNDLNREKQQWKKEYPGDNPMSTEMSLDEELESLLDSILIKGSKTMPAPRRPATPTVPATPDLEEGLFDTDADLQARSPQYKALKAMEPKYKGTQYEPQLQQRIGAAQARAASGAGEVMDYNPKTGQQVPRPVLPPEQYKAK